MIPVEMKRRLRPLVSDPRVKGWFRLLLAGSAFAMILAAVVGLPAFANASLAIIRNVTSLSATDVLAIAASAIAVVGFAREVPAWSQSITKSGGGQSVHPSRRTGDDEMHPAISGVSLRPYGLARRYVLESVTLSVPTNDPAIASLIVLVVKSKDRKLYEGAISIGNDLLSGDESVGLGQYFSVTRQVHSGFTGDLEYSIFNHTDQMLMCYVTLRMRSVHSLGELMLERFFPSASILVLGLLKFVFRVLAFEPDSWAMARIAARGRR